MGRPRKQTADWFPHYVADSRTKFILEDKWGNNGYAFWFKLLELLCKSDGHNYSCADKMNMKYLVAVTKVNEETAMEILNTLADLGKIDGPLWEQHRIIWCQSLVDNLSTMYSKRTVSVPEKPIFNEFSNRKLSNNEVSDSGNPYNTVHNNTIQDNREHNTNKCDCEPNQCETEPCESLTVEEIKMAGTATGKETCEQPSKTLVERRFDEFWAAYPKKVGKKAAWTAWKKVKPDAELFDKIMTAIGRAKATWQWQRENGRYIPNPKTWLNEGRWDDEYKEEPMNGINSKHFDGYNQQPATSSPGAESKKDTLAGFKRAEDYYFYSRSIDKEK